MNFSKYILSILVLFLFSTQINAQKEFSANETDVQNIIVKLFDGMREGDSAKVASVFSKNVRMFSSYTKKTGEEVLHEGKLSEFLKAIDTPHDEIWDEKIWDTEIQIDGNLAQVWTQYGFYIGEKFSHCGVDAFQLIKENDSWKIINLMDTRRVVGCEQTK